MKHSKIYFSFIVLFSLISSASNAAVYTWIGANNAKFNITTNFSPTRLFPFSKTDTIVFAPGLGGDTVISESNYQTGTDTSFFFQVGMIHVMSGRTVTFNGTGNTFTYTYSLMAYGMGGRSLQIDTNATLNLYSNANLWGPVANMNWTELRFGDATNGTPLSDIIIDGKLTINIFFKSNPALNNGFGTCFLKFFNSRVICNGIFEILSDSMSLNQITNRISFPTPSKMYVNGDLIYSGGRQNITFKDSSLEVNNGGRVILNFKGNGNENNLMGIYKQGSQLVINSHPGSDTALIVLPDSVENIIVNTTSNSNPITFVAKSLVGNSSIPIRVKGNVIINSTGIGGVEFNSVLTGKHATIEGNLTINGGRLQVRNPNPILLDMASRLIVNGNYLQNLGTLDYIGTHPNIGQFLVKGNFFQYGGAIKNTSGSALPQIVFNGIAPQTIRIGSNVDDSITFVFDNAGGFVLDSNLILGTGSVVNFVNGTFSGSGSILYGSSGSALMFSNQIPHTASNYLWSTSKTPFNVYLNNPAPITIPGSYSIGRSLTVGEGILDMASTDSLIIGDALNAAIVQQTGTGRIRGKLSLWLKPTQSSYLFPLGSYSKSKSIEVTYTAAPTSAGTLSATYVNSIPGNNGLPIIQGSDSVFRTLDDGYWTVKNGNGLNSGTYSIKAFGNNVSGASQIQNLTLVKRNNFSSPWTLPGIAQPSVGKLDSFFLSRSNLTGFSDFSIAESKTVSAEAPISNNNINGNQIICSGTSPDLLTGSLPSGGNGIFTYLWIQSATGVSGPYSAASGLNNSINYSPSVLNNSVWYKRIVFSGNSSDTTTFITIETRPKLKAGFTINKQIQCLKGNEFIFTDTTFGNTNRLWIYGNGDTSTSEVLTLNFPSGPQNSYSIKLISSVGSNCADTLSKNVFVVSNPIAKTISGNTNVDVGNKLLYDVPFTNGSSYQWFFQKGTGTSTTNSIEILWSTSGEDLIKMIEKSASNCYGDTMYLSVLINQSSGIPSYLNASNTISIYPNPSNGLITIKNSKQEDFVISVFDILGKNLLNQTIKFEQSSNSLDLSELSNGTYFIHFKNENENTIIKKIEIYK